MRPMTSLLSANICWKPHQISLNFGAEASASLFAAEKIKQTHMTSLVKFTPTSFSRIILFQLKSKLLKGECSLHYSRKFIAG